MIAELLQPALDDILSERGLTTAANDANWRPFPFHNQRGWAYPVYNSAGKPYQTADGKTALRWKNADSNGSPKYAWVYGKPQGVRYYLLADTLQAIKAKKGVCYLASGEPDVLAYRAAGIHNVLCWFDGEPSIPDTFAADMEKIGVTALNDFPDRDTTGLEKTARLSKLLQGSSVLYMTFALPGDVGSKNDVNWLWQHVKFDRSRFQLELLDCEAYTESDLTPYQKQESAPLVQRETRSTEIRLTDNQQTAVEKVAFARFAEALKRHIEIHPGVRRWDTDGWSNNFKCDFHQEQNASAGLNRDSLVYRCFAGNCVGTLTAVEYGEKIGVSLDTYRREVEAEFAAPKPKPETALNVLPKPDSDTKPRKLYTESDDALAEVEAILSGASIPDYTPVPFPYTALHPFGGFAEIMIPGKLIYIMGVSGGGKTSFAETIAEKMQKEGQDFIWFGPEWNAQEMRKRSIQRAGGMTLTQMARYELWLIEKQRGIPPEQRLGIPPSQDKLNHTLEIVRRMKDWRGKGYQLNADPALGSTAAILDTIRDIVNEKRAAGRMVTTLFIDYIQRMPKVGHANWDQLEVVTTAVKSLCEELSLFGFILIQPKKSDSKSTRDGEVLTEAAAQGLSDHQANLFITLTPVFDEDGQKQPSVKARVVKNSAGQTGEVRLAWAWQYLTIADRVIAP